MVGWMSESLDVLIVVAHEMELSGLGPGFGATPVRGLHVATRGVGVGLPAASAGTARSLRDARPRAVVLLGSCGIFPEASRSAALLQPVVPSDIQLVELAVATKQAAFPDPMPRLAAVDRALADGLARFAPDVRRGSLATTLGITTSDEVAQTLERASGCTTENLEALGVALACEAERVPFAALLVVTNVVGSTGRSDWLRNHKPAAERGGRIVIDWLEAGAPGVSR
jgi:nucleoside phosphorylase